MRYLFLFLLISGCASTGSNNCDHYQAIEDCQAERNSFFNRDAMSNENDNYEYCQQIVPQCDNE